MLSVVFFSYEVLQLNWVIHLVLPWHRLRAGNECLLSEEEWFKALWGQQMIFHLLQWVWFIVFFSDNSLWFQVRGRSCRIRSLYTWLWDGSSRCLIYCVQEQLGAFLIKMCDGRLREDIREWSITKEEGV